MKRLILCCDGTWHDADRQRPSNVLVLARAIAPASSQDVPQITLYLPGIGADSVAPLTSAATGLGLDRDIQDAYRFLVHNYHEGDEIWCFGYSRGAYAVRSLVGLLRNTWLLHKSQAQRIAAAYHIYRTLWGADADNATRFRLAWCRPVEVHFLGVWDTVGALGIPVPVLRTLSAERYSFHDTSLSGIVRNARHALAIDERRKAFAPTLWHTRRGRTHTEQCWFSGGHADVGGGLRKAELSAISLRWISEAAMGCGLSLDENFLESVYDLPDATTVGRRTHGIWGALGRQWRAIGETNHDETVHSTAEQRFLRDPGYRPQNLKAYMAINEQLRLPL